VERDVYSYERTPTDIAPFGAKPGNGTFAEAGKSNCAPTELRSKERTGSYKHLAPLRPISGEATNNSLLQFQLEFAGLLREAGVARCL
jgi:hypothetical protein